MFNRSYKEKDYLHFDVKAVCTNYFTNFFEVLLIWRKLEGKEPKAGYNKTVANSIHIFCWKDSSTSALEFIDFSLSVWIEGNQIKSCSQVQVGSHIEAIAI